MMCSSRNVKTMTPAMITTDCAARRATYLMDAAGGPGRTVAPSC
jgi:hypothetical protein